MKWSLEDARVRVFRPSDKFDELQYISCHPAKTSEIAVIFTWDNGVGLTGTEQGDS